MQLSCARQSGRSTGALLLPVEAVASAEPSRAVARDEQEAYGLLLALRLRLRESCHVDRRDGG
jgi:hypothetical protein